MFTTIYNERNGSCPITMCRGLWRYARLLPSATEGGKSLGLLCEIMVTGLISFWVSTPLHVSFRVNWICIHFYFKWKWQSQKAVWWTCKAIRPFSSIWYLPKPVNLQINIVKSVKQICFSIRLNRCSLRVPSHHSFLFKESKPINIPSQNVTYSCKKVSHWMNRPWLY